MKWRNLNKFSIVVFCFFLLTSNWSVGSMFSDEMPGGNWTLSSHPLWSAAEPVNVVSVTTHLKRLTVTSVGVRNGNNKRISSVSFKWFIVRISAGQSGQEEYNVKAWGETPTIGISGGIAPGTTAEVAFPFVSFIDQAPAFWEQQAHTLSGEYRIYVGVNEIRYEDSTVEFALLWPFPPILIWPCPGCAMQKCELNRFANAYRCVGSGACEFCTNNNTSCTTTLCRAPGGDG
ncbi:MAG: hypothetical protein RMM98_11680 [Acidobacteriota bacterium]|nr:hypothetical protein [Blastocatellia bacterium]MDW8240268.1 hypothetical protein [Acidobacteriota bacterium]